MRVLAMIVALVGSQLALPSGALAQHASQSPPSASAKGPTVVHDAAFAGATVIVNSIPVPYSALTIVVLDVNYMPELARGRILGAHAHASPCGADPLASGGHHQNPDAKDPAIALGAKEVWLDLSIDSRGRGIAIALIDWRLRKGQAGSVVVHALPTNSTTGAAGARVLCTTVPFND